MRGPICVNVPAVVTLVSIILGATISYIIPSVQGAGGEICPIGWYVSAVKKVHLGKEHNGLRSISFDLVLYFDHRVSITGLTLSTKNLELKANNPVISVTEVYPIPALESFHEVYKDNEWFLNRVTELSRGKAISALEKEAPCRIPDFIPGRMHSEFKINSTHRLQKRYYHSHEACVLSFLDDKMTKNWHELIPDYKDDSLVVAEGYTENYLFQFDAHDNLLITKYSNESELLRDKVLFNNANVNSEKYTTNFLNLTKNPSCQEMHKRLLKLSQKVRAVHDVIKPLKSLTGLDSATYYMLPSKLSVVGDEESIKVIHQPDYEVGAPDPEFGFNIRSKFPAYDYSLEAMSFCSFGYKKPIDIRLIFTGKKKRKRLYLTYQSSNDFKKTTLISNHSSSLTLIPDDITHWPMCDRIVALYGYAYTIHNLDENILENNKVAQVLPLKLGAPIVAIHADPDDLFWFVTMQTRVFRAYAISSMSCTTLNFGPMKETSLAHAFGIQDYAMRDNLFYDRVSRTFYNMPTDDDTIKPPRQTPVPVPIPLPPRPLTPAPGPYPPYTPHPTNHPQPPPPTPVPAPIPLPPKSNFMTWIYILCGLVLGVVVIIIIVMQILNSTTQSRPNVVYSRSKDMNQISTPVQQAKSDPQTSKESQATTATQKRGMAPTASTMPLFSAHSSAMKSTGSRGSQGSKIRRRSSVGSGTRSPRKKTPKSTKTTGSGSKSPKSPKTFK